MAKQITLEQALQLVEFQYVQYLTRPPEWRVSSVLEDVCGDVHGHVYGKINGRKWYFAETPKEKLKRLVKENAGKEELYAAINQLEDN
jgi:hypothetical protein